MFCFASQVLRCSRVNDSSDVLGSEPLKQAEEKAVGAVGLFDLPSVLFWLTLEEVVTVLGPFEGHQKRLVGHVWPVGLVLDHPLLRAWIKGFVCVGPFYGPKRRKGKVSVGLSGSF